MSEKTKKLSSVIISVFSIAGLLVGALSHSQIVSAASVGDGERLITIHDRGEEKSLISHHDTLREVFDEAEIDVDPNDIVEPGLDETLPGNNYQVNIYRARPVVIVDGASQLRVMSAHQTPRKIAENAGIVLQDEDEAQMTVTNNPLVGGLGVKMVIDRATPVNLVLYGKKEKVYTQATTVSDFLEEKDITLAEKDTLSVDRDRSITPGMKVEIWRNGKQVVTVDEAIAYQVEQIQDSDREAGYRKVTTPGVKGKKAVTYEIIRKNGKEISRKALRTVVIKQAKKQVEIVGIKQKSLSGNCASWMKAAGINDMASANYLIGQESGCNPYAVNPTSGACGVGQEHPCGKSGCALGDGACQVRWMNSYVLGRYGSWANAANYHRAHNSY